MIDGANAARLHLKLFDAPRGFFVIGVGGRISVKLTRIGELNLNGNPLHDVEFIVGGNDMGGGKVGLLGRNFLEVADAEYDFAHGAGELDGRCRARALSGSDLPLALADCNEALKHAAKSSPFFAEISDSRALVLLRLGRYDKSIADFDASLKIEAKDAWSLYGRGLAEMRTNQAPAGQADIAKARALSLKITDRFAKFGLLP